MEDKDRIVKDIIKGFELFNGMWEAIKDEEYSVQAPAICTLIDAVAVQYGQTGYEFINELTPVFKAAEKWLK